MTLPNDCLTLLFSFLQHGKDLISCSKVNRSWYRASSNNYLWYNIIKNKVKNLIQYNDRVSWKIIYLRLSKCPYESQIASLYKEFHLDFKQTWNRRDAFIAEKLLWTSIVYVPMILVAFPLSIGIESYTLLFHQMNKHNDCKCDSCSSSISRKIRTFRY
jgi:hypothetical protein